MTREDIENCFSYHSADAAIEYYKQEYLQPRKIDSRDIVDAFENGAEWAQKFIINRACDWLELNINDDKYYSCIGEETLMPYLIEDFRKAMEE